MRWSCLDQINPEALEDIGGRVALVALLDRSSSYDELDYALDNALYSLFERWNDQSIESPELDLKIQAQESLERLISRLEGFRRGLDLVAT